MHLQAVSLEGELRVHLLHSEGSEIQRFRQRLSSYAFVPFDMC